MKKFVKYVGNAVCALSILFIVWALSRMDFDFGQIKDWRMFAAVCTAGIAFKTATVFLSAYAWCLWLEFFAGKRCDRKEALRVYAKANIGKYLPGNVMHYAGRNLFAGQLDLSQKQIAAATLGEIAGLVCAAFSMSALLAYSQMTQAVHAVFRQLLRARESAFWQLNGTGQTVLLICILLILAAVMAVCIRKTAQRHSIRKGIFSKRSLKTFLAVILIYAAVLTVLGLIFVFLYWYWGGSLQETQPQVIVSAYIISWVLGFAVPGAPGGIGVREMTLTLLLSPVIGRDVTAVLSVLHRIITIIGDFMAYLLRKRL